MRLKTKNHTRGFTLIEIVITITITAILSTMIFTYFGETVTKSTRPIMQLKSSAALQRVMENITADYNVYPKWRSGTVYTAGSRVIPTNFNGFYYQCTIAGTSGTSEPLWPLGITPYTETTGTGVQWTKSGSLRTFRPLTTLKTSIGAEGTDQDNAYGKYHVEKNKFTHFDVNGVDLDSDDIGANANKILKVTLRNDIGETQTALFVSD